MEEENCSPAMLAENRGVPLQTCAATPPFIPATQICTAKRTKHVKFTEVTLSFSALSMTFGTILELKEKRMFKV